MKNMMYQGVLVLAKAKKDVYTQSVTKAFKPMLDILEAIMKGMQPFIVVLTAFAVVMQLIKGYQSFQRGDTYQKQVYTVIALIFCATLILTYNAWLIPILKKVAGI